MLTWLVREVKEAEGESVEEEVVEVKTESSKTFLSKDKRESSKLRDDINKK